MNSHCLFPGPRQPFEEAQRKGRRALHQIRGCKVGKIFFDLHAILMEIMKLDQQFMRAA